MRFYFLSYALGFVLVATSCTPPQAPVVAEEKPLPKAPSSPVKPKAQASEPKEQELTQMPSTPKPTPATDPFDGLRMPDLLALPQNNQFQASAVPSRTAGATSATSTTVIARPPAE